MSCGSVVSWLLNISTTADRRAQTNPLDRRGIVRNRYWKTCLCESMVSVSLWALVDVYGDMEKYRVYARVTFG